MIPVHKTWFHAWNMSLHNRRRRKMEKILISGKGHFSSGHWRHIRQCPECRVAYDQWAQINTQIPMEDQAEPWRRLPSPLAPSATARLTLVVWIPVLATALFAFWFSVGQEQVGLRSAVRARGSGSAGAIAAGSLPGLRFFVGDSPDNLLEVLPDSHQTLVLQEDAWLQLAYANPTSHIWLLDLTITSDRKTVLHLKQQVEAVQQKAINHALSVQELPRQGLIEARLHKIGTQNEPRLQNKQSFRVIRTAFRVDNGR